MTNPTDSPRSYRADIDGLRAIAVLSVLLFHAGFKSFSGGFIGVDVFFVISGFLITDVIRRSIVAGQFSFSSFYSKRLLRLQPALLATIAICVGAGFLLMDPASFSTLATSAKYSVFSASNFYFWLNQGYFDAAAATQPLLHTWSLAVEWQFYAIWPFIVWAALKVSQKCLAWVLVLVTVISVGASQVMLSYDSSAAYFMMPFRIFELSIGALLVFIKDHRVGIKAESTILFVGLVLIAVSVVTLKPASPFPGIRGLIPSIGAAACIYAGRSDGRLGKALRTKQLVYIGLISYSVYLVHWPILVFYKYYIFHELDLLDKLALAGISILAGAAMFHSIERLFLGKSKAVRWLGLTAVAAGTAGLAVAAISIYNHQGFKLRVPVEYLALAEDPVNFHLSNWGGSGYPTLQPELGTVKAESDMVIGGDSFAFQYANGLDLVMRERGVKVFGFFSHGCYVSKSYTRIDRGTTIPNCPELYDSIMNALQNNNKAFIFAQHWSAFKNGVGDRNGNPVIFKTEDEYQNFIIDDLKEMRSAIGKRPLIIIGSPPFIGGQPHAASCLLRPRIVPQPCESKLTYEAKNTEPYAINKRLKAFAQVTDNTYYIDPADVLCVEGVCSPLLQDQIVFSDQNHISIEGSRIVVRAYEDELIQIIRHSGATKLGNAPNSSASVGTAISPL